LVRSRFLTHSCNLAPSCFSVCLRSRQVCCCSSQLPTRCLCLCLRCFKLQLQLLKARSHLLCVALQVCHVSQPLSLVQQQQQSV
jgi:hypothetical protein